MFRTLRENAGLTQSQVAEAIGRSPNYVLKAEDLTFPAPPASLVEFYSNQLDKETIKSWYRESQRTQRYMWLETHEPVILGATNFRTAWRSTTTGAFPTQYGLSKGLCLPASIVYSMEAKPSAPAVVVECMDQLLSFVESGEFNQQVNFDERRVNFVLSGLKSIKELLKNG